jgi:signal transduction histidine kinase
MEYYIPIHTRDEWAGLLTIGRKIMGGSYTENELALLGTMTDMLTLALQNIRLGESLLRVNNEFRRTYQSMEQSNRQLKQILSKLEKVDRSKSDFIHIASHELRTPLTVMLGYNELLRDDPELKSNEYQAQLIDGIHKGIMRMHEVVESMLVMATIDARSLALNKQQVSIGAVIHAVQGSLVTALEDRQLDLTIEKVSDLPLIEADGEALQKVFQQVISNAIKYTPDGGTITVMGSPATIGPESMTEPGVEIIVSDTGIGIDPKNLEMIFTKFYMTGDLAHHSSGKTKFKGAGPGLGLAIAKGIIEAHGGKVWAISPGYDEEKCPGSQFHILLPLKNILD